MAEDTETEPTYDEDLGEIWSLTAIFTFKGYDATSITWNFGDGTPEETGFAIMHTFPGKGTYYVTQTAHNTLGDSVAIYKVTMLGYPYVEFNTLGGSPIDKIEMTSGGINATAATEPEEIPTKTGYTFTGWYTTSECTELYDWTKVVDAPVTLYAGWSENPKATISFNVDEGYPPVESVQWTIGTEYTIPTYEGTKEGFVFGGWSFDGQTYLAGEKIVVTDDMELTAVWNALDQYTVTFNTDGGSTIPAQKVYANGTATEPETDPTKTGHTFAGWFTADGTPYDFETPITANTTIYAHWTPVNYTVSFNVNGGEGTFSDQTVPYGSKATNPGSPTRDNYSFNGWYLNGTPYNFDTPVTGNITLVADWSYIQTPVERHTVTFNPDNGQEQWTSTVVDGNTVNMITPVKVGYEFVGWFSGETQYTSSTPINSDVTLTAHWTAKQFTVTYEDDDGDVISERVVKYSAYAPNVSASKDGYRFDGWYLGGQPYDFKQRVTSDLTLTAKWTVIQNVQVDIPEGVQVTEPIPEDVVSGDSIRLPEASKDGETFVGWKDQDGNIHQAGDNIEITDDTTLTPVFEEIPEGETQHQITIEGAPELNFDTWYTEDGTVVLPEIDREGQTHTGWQDQDGNVYDVGDEIQVTGDITLTPVFEPKQPIDTAIPEIGDDVILGGDLPDTVYEGSEVTLPDASKDGEKFVGWDTNGDGVADRQPGETVVIDEDTVLEPVFDELGEDDVQHTVTVDTDGDGTPDQEWYPVNDGDYTLPDPGERPGYDFDGYVDQDGEIWQPGDSFTPAEDTTFEGQWTAQPTEENSFDYTIDFGNGFTEQGFVMKGESYTFPAAPTRNGYDFVAWNVAGGRFQPDDDFVPAGDFTVKAVWKAKEVASFTVSYQDGDGKTLFADRTVMNGGKAPMPKAPSKDGYEFVCWTLDGKAYDFNTVLTKDITLVATWKPVHKVDVTIPDGAVTDSEMPTDVAEGDVVELPDASKDGQQFVGWDTDNDGVADKQPGDSVVIDKDTTLTPVFEDMPEGSESTKVEFGGVEGSDLGYDQWFSEDGKVTLPDADKDDQKLVGWDTDGDGLADAQPGDTIDIPESGKIDAVWEDKSDVKVDVTVEDDVSVSEKVPETVKEGDEVVLPDATRPGQVLDGWDTDGDGVVDKLPGETVTIDKDTVFEPVWSDTDDKQHTVVIDADGGSAPFEKWYPVDGQPVTLPEPSKDGAQFDGWYDIDGNKVGDAGDVFYPTEDTVLVAHWTEDSDDGVWFLVGAVVCGIVAALLVVLYATKCNQWYVLVGVAVAVIAAVVCALFYAEVL